MIRALSLSFIFFCLSFSSTTAQVVEKINVEVPAGCVPRLPYRLWVTYADGTGEYRQVRWQNSSPSREQAEADAKAHPAGTVYTVKGLITGLIDNAGSDNRVLDGLPVEARILVTEAPWPVPSAAPVARTLPLHQVSIDGDNRLTHNRYLDISHLLTLDPRQQLYNYRDTYGLSTDGYPVADGWDSPTTKLKGHGTGHYLSALALAFASCQNMQQKALLRQRITLMVNEMRACQERTFTWSDSLGRYFEARDVAPAQGATWTDFDRYKQDYRHYGYGYLNAIPPQHCTLIEQYTPYNNERGVWAPYYTVHKQLAGLIDVATYIDDKDLAAKALLTARDMGLWVWNRLHYCTFVKADGTQEERRQRPGNRYEMWNMYIAGEVGGMAESLARLAALTADSTLRARLTEAAECFNSPAFFDPLARGIDAIRTRHANQHIPMITGALHIFRNTGNPYYYNLAQNFWLMIQGRYRYAMGGVGNGEMFRQPYSQMTSMLGNKSSWGGRVVSEPTMNETCCAYNLAKLTKDLACHHPNDARYMDYYERVLYNQIIGSLNPRKYQTVYQYAVGLNASKPWGNETPQETCCGGTGAENHVKYQEATYFVAADTLWVALYMPTTATWQEKGVNIRQQCQWPAEKSTISISSTLSPKEKKTFTMRLRVPYWATSGFGVTLNGKPVAKSYQPGTYIEIPARRWKEKDVVEVTMPFTQHWDYGPDKADGHWLAAPMHGPLVMAATGITTWEEATVTLGKWDDKDVIPDYDADSGVTHYFRMVADSSRLALPTSPLAIDKDELRELMLVARQRQQEQQEWNEKQNGSAPWAPHAFQRMQQQMTVGQQLLDTPDSQCHQDSLNLAAAALSTVINSMRPGNLPELEDLQPLMALVEQAKQQSVSGGNDSPSNAPLTEALNYAGMVIRYVGDGSGTYDMIERATRQLQLLLK